MYTVYSIHVHVYVRAHECDEKIYVPSPKSEPR